MKEYVELVRVIVWPILVAIALFAFDRPIRQFLTDIGKRVSKLSAFGIELGLEPLVEGHIEALKGTAPTTRAGRCFPKYKCCPARSTQRYGPNGLCRDRPGQRRSVVDFPCFHSCHFGRSRGVAEEWSFDVFRPRRSFVAALVVGAGLLARHDRPSSLRDFFNLAACCKRTEDRFRRCGHLYSVMVIPGIVGNLLTGAAQRIPRVIAGRAQEGVRKWPAALSRWRRQSPKLSPPPRATKPADGEGRQRPLVRFTARHTARVDVRLPVGNQWHQTYSLRGRRRVFQELCVRYGMPRPRRSLNPQEKSYGQPSAIRIVNGNWGK